MLTSSSSRANRRGIVLVLVLGMLGLLALVGITFATFAGQARVNNRNYMLSLLRPQADELLDFALAQLITDTNDVRSAIRGHSLARDMFGNDAFGNAFVSSSPTTGLPLAITAVAVATTTAPGPPPVTTNNSTLTGAVYNLTTNILSADPAFYGTNFTRWTMRLAYTGGVNAGVTGVVNQTFEILNDNTTAEYRVFQVSISSADAGGPSIPFIDDPHTIAGENTALVNVTPNVAFPVGYVTQLPGQYLVAAVTAGAMGANTFTLDGRWLRAFNGPGMGSQFTTVTLGANTYNIPNSYYGNFRYNGLSPSAAGMDEDYDACDLENWFLAIQSADGQVMIPSFHRPGIIRNDPAGLGGVVLDDWTGATADSTARILRPRQADGNDLATFPDLVPNATTGQISYDVDNDGDSVTDSVWLDLGYPARQDSSGRLYKPLFAFMVIGLNGRIPLNTAGNLAGHVAAAVVDAGLDSDGAGPAHASHLGNSVSEVDPTYALQNGFNPTTGDAVAAFAAPQVGVTYPIGTGGTTTASNSQVDNGGIDVRLTQLRNLLAGTRPLDTTGSTFDNNFVFYTQGQAQQVQLAMPNGIMDYNAGLGYGGGNAEFVATGANATPVDANTGLPYLQRFNTPVPGRWGEAQSIPGLAINTGAAAPLPAVANVVLPTYGNPVRAGYSWNISDIINGQPFDAADDNFNSYDPYPIGHTGEVGDLDMYDAAGALVLPVERMRRWLAPADINGTGSVTTWNQGARSRPLGGDLLGRVEFSSYFRPPGSPGVITTNYTYNEVLHTFASTNGNILGAISFPTGVALDPFYTSGPDPAVTALTTPAYLPDMTSNPFHGFESFRFPNQAYAANPNAYPNAAFPVTGNPSNNTVGSFTPQTVGGVPVDYFVNATNMPIQFPTYDFQVNALVHSDGLNEADEMNLYSPQPLLDSPYQPPDLEWLYRQQDVDGASLSSRLQKLAPVSFTNTIDGLKRRRLFSLQSSDLNNFVWANDNPATGTFPLGAFATNSAQLLTGALAAPASSVAQNSSFGQLSANLNAVSAATTPIVMPTPTLGQRDKKINLNYPLPVSNDPNEPIRQKWISDTYQLLKYILPPKAVDTPEELAQLSQFVINIIDFRDPDCAMTHWVNPDVMLTGLVSVSTTAPPAIAAIPTTQPYLCFIPQGGIPATAAGVTSQYAQLDQYGMESNPVAINEALAYSFFYNPGAGPVQANRFFVELVNTLTTPETAPPPPAGGVGGGGGAAGSFDASQLDLGGFQYLAGDPYSGGTWDIVITGDDPYSRPDPFRGELVPYSNIYGLMPLNRDSFNAYGTNAPPGVDVTLTPLTQASTIPLPPNTQTTPPTDYFYAFGNNPFGTGAVYENGSPSPLTFYPIYTSTYYDIPLSNPPAPAAPAPNVPTLVQTLATAFDPLTGAGSSTSPIPIYQGVLPGVQLPTAGNPSTTTLPTNCFTTVPTLAKGGATYIWVCLRRPANPFAPVTPTNPMLVVDSARVPYIDGSGQGTPTTDAAGNPYVLGNFNAIYSMQRIQPYRGGHAVPLAQPPAPAPVPPANQVDPRYGYSEQIVAPTTNSLNSLLTQGIYSINAAGTVKYPATFPIYHTLGWANEGEQGAQQGALNAPYEPWDYFPFNDRDFTSVAELMLVPACPPALFTKQFGEFAPSYNNIQNIFSNVSPLATPTFVNAAPTTAPPANVPSGWVATVLPVAPYLAGTLNAVAVTASQPYLQYTNWTTGNLTFNAGAFQPHTYPYLTDKFFYSGYGGANTLDTGGGLVGGYTADGWFKMFEFFEVPSQVIGAIGPVAQGTNFDWLRQDTKPGQLNLNLIIDEEVFCSVLGQQLTNYATGNTQGINQQNGQPLAADGATVQIQSNQFSQQLLNFDQIQGGYLGNSTLAVGVGNYALGQNTVATGNVNFPLLQGSPPVPLVVTATLSNGAPASAYPLTYQGYGPATNSGVLDLDPVTGYFYSQTAAPVTSQPYSNALKASWVQFLTLRHGGSGYLFGFGTGAVGCNVALNGANGVAGYSGIGPPPVPAVGIPADIPFHSLSYPDIDYTIMRPAALPPTAFTTPVPNPPAGTAAATLYTTYNPSTYVTNLATGLATGFFTGDPGVRNFNLYAPYYPSAVLPANPTGATAPLWGIVPPAAPAVGALPVQSAYAPGTAFPQYTVANPPSNPPTPAAYWPVFPPAIPPRRLFQTPDSFNPALAALPTNVTPTPSNASEIGDPTINLLTVIPNPAGAGVFLPTPAPGAFPPIQYGIGVGALDAVLTNSVVNLYWPGDTPATIIDPAAGPVAAQPPTPAGVRNHQYLGAGTTAANIDMDQHPYWRSEQLQRVMNLTTTRTHQYAVWITIGFFEVKRQGDLGMLAFNPQLAFDIMGPEVGAANGKTTRYRGFYLVDRLQLTGFNPTSPSGFRPAVVYRQRIQ